MLNSIFYIFPALALAIGLLFYVVGRAKKNSKLIGIGIGFIFCLIVVEAPDFIDGFMNGFGDGFNS